LNEHREAESRRSRTVTVLSIVASLVVGALIYTTLMKSGIVLNAGGQSLIGGMENNVEQIADVLFSRYFVPFELISLLLLAAIIGAVFLSRKRV